MSKKLIVIAAIAVMLAGATSAYGYYEAWDGWFNSGYLTYDGYTYDYVEGVGEVADTTNGDVDEFFLDAIAVITFYCSGNGGTIVVSLTSSTGWKYTGQSGQKEAYEGEWADTATLTITGFPPVVFDSVWGTWQSTDPDCFNYDSRPDPTYTASWFVTGSDPPGIEGQGTSAGKLLPE